MKVAAVRSWTRRYWRSPLSERGFRKSDMYST
jgi:hypothetical protein